MTESPKKAARRLAAPAIADGYKPEALHVYTDVAGEPIYWRIRMKHPDTGEKWIRPMRLNGVGYELGEPSFSDGKPLYGLDAMAARPEAPVFLVEGEWCVDHLAKAGLLATTSGAADSVAAADFSPLAERTVVIWPDNDDPGRRFASEAEARLRSLGCTVRQIDVDVLDPPPKGDAVDWLDAHAGADTDEIERLPCIDVAAASPTAAGIDKAQESNDWPEPQPLPDGLPPVDSFDLALMPDSLRPYVGDIAERMQCPPEFVGVPVMVALGSLIGRQVGIRPQGKTDWTEIPNLWGVIVGRPGLLKSPAMESALWPLKRLDAKARETYEEALKDYYIRRRELDLRAETGQQAAKEKLRKDPTADISELLEEESLKKPTLRRYQTTNSTVEALAELLRENPNGVLVYRDEIVSLLKTLGREEKAEDRGFYLTGWNGSSSHTADRIGRGLGLHTPVVCLSLLGSTQPNKLSGYLRSAVVGDERDDGLIQRFNLIVWPDTDGSWRDVDRPPDREARDGAWSAFSALDRIDPEMIGAEFDVDPDGEQEGPPYLRFDPEALEEFRRWRPQFEGWLRGDIPPALEAHFAKYRKLVPALALICHLADGRIGPVGEAPLVQALAWAKYLATHARRAYGFVTNADAHAARAIISKIKSKKLPMEFSSRDVSRPQWSGLSDRSTVQNALELLDDRGWLATREEPSRGRPRTIYRVNPRVLPK